MKLAPRVCSLLCAAVLLPAGVRAAGVSIAEIPNFVQVDGHLFRGGQPEDGAWPRLSAIGVRTVIDLRRAGEHSTQAESLAVTAAGMRYVNFPMNGFDTPQSAEMARVLGLIGERDTVFVHCRQGRDRTGTVVAAYRISHDHWTQARALEEAETHGLHWYERGMKRFIMAYRVATSTLASTSTPALDTGAHASSADAP